MAMVSTKCGLLLIALAILVGLFSVSATARPCKTFVVSSYSVSFQNPNNPSTASARLVTVVSEIRRFNHGPAHLRLFPGALQERLIQHRRSIYRPSPSLLDPTKDIFGVFAALLFGVGCGALTGAVMSLGWLLFCRSCLKSDEDSDVGACFSPKKMGYVKISADTQNERLDRLTDA